MGMRSASQVLGLALLCALAPACGGGGVGGGAIVRTPNGGIQLVLDINTRQASSSAKFLCVAGSTVYFTATEWVHGEELWKTDGTPGGSVLVKDINPGAGGSLPRCLGAAGPYVFFSCVPATSTQLWRTDGSEAG